MKNNFYKILSIILSVAMIFSVCGTVASADTTFGENAYFVKNGGTGDGTSDTNPAPTVYAAIETINKTLGEGDVANIYIMQRDDWNNHTEGVHGMAYWADKSADKNNSAIVPEHKAQIIVQAYDADVKTYLAYTGILGQNVSMALNGPTTFKNITILSPRYQEISIEANGNNALFGEGTEYAYYESWSVPTSNGTFSIKNRTALSTTTGIYADSGTITDDVNITFENEFKSSELKNSIVIDTRGYGTYTYEKDINLTFNNEALAPIIYLGDGQSNAGSTEIKGNLNINAKSATSVTVNENPRPLTVGGYQVLLSGGAEYTGDVAQMSNVTVNGGAWYLTNESAYSDLLEFTDVAGTYTVKSGHEAVATDILGNKYYSENGVLTLPAGEYTADEYIPPVTKDYYVKYGGTGDGRRADSPVATVYDAIKAVNDDLLGKGDIANIYIMQDENWKDVNSTVDGSTNPVHGLTAWAVDSAVPEAHTAQLVVQPYSGNTGKTYLATGDKYGIGDYMEISGPTTFKNIAIITGAGYQGVKINGNSVTFDADDVSFKAWGYLSAWPAVITERNSTATFFGAGGTVTEEVNINYNYSYSTHSISGSWNPEKLYLGKNVYKVNDVYNEDFNLTFNVLDSNQIRLVFGNSNSDINFKKNLNINIKSLDALVLENKTSTKVTIDGAFQLIKPAETIFTEAASFVDKTNIPAYIEDFTGVTVNGGCWYITNESEFDDLLTFTSQAGLYAVKSGYNAVAVNVETGIETTSENGALKLEAGDYTVTATRIPVVKDYYVKNGGTGDGRTVETPAATVADVIASVNADLISGDIANIYIMRSENRELNVGELVGGEGVNATPVHGYTAWSTDGTVPEHDATIVVQAYDTTETTYLTFSDKVGGNQDMVLSGPTEFDNITIVSVRKTYRQIKLGGNSVTYGANVKYGKMNHGYEDSTAKEWSGAISNSAGLAIYSGSGSNEITEDVNIVIESTYSSSDKNTSFYLTSQTYAKDYNITVDNAEAAPQVYTASGSGTTSIAGNLSINVKNAKSFALLENGGTLSVGGGIQVLVDSNITYTGKLTSFSNVTAEKGIWVVKVAADMKNAVSATDTLGTYSIIDGYTAIATDAEGNEYLSTDGMLTLPANGEYEVNIVDFYLNNGETITVYNEVEIDLSGEKHTAKDGKIFIGWTKADGSYAEQVATYVRGDVLTAQYTDFSADSFVIEETQIRTSGELGLRFIVKQNKADVANIPNIQEYGAITLPTDVAGGREIYLDEGVVVTWSWDTEKVNEFSPATYGETPVKVVADNILEETETEKRYTLCITGVEEEYDTFYTAKGYIKYTDNNGVSRAIHTAGAQTSIYKLAAEAVANGEESEIYYNIITTVKAERTEYANGLTATVKNTYVNGTKTVTNEFASLSNGLRLRTMTVDSGMDIEKMEIGWLSDVHLNYINQRDVEEQVVNALSAYRGRSWNRDGGAINRIISAIEYTNTFEKTIVTGDMVDYLSWGSLYLTDNLITRKSVNGSILMTTGNHEFAESCEPDIKGLPDQMTLEEKYARLQAVWSNDAKYHEEILYTDSGKENVMLVLLDNGLNSTIYPDGTTEKFQASVDKARELGIPVLVYQHVPMLTMNPNETAVYVGGGYDMGFGTAENHESVYDMTSTATGGFVNPNSADEEIKNVCAIIRQNPDVIKGVFNGHKHESFYTEIAATDAEGNLIKDENNNLVVIPQFTMSATAYGFVSKIVIE